MNRKGLYDLRLCDFNELISDVKVALRNKNKEYKKLQEKLENIMDNHPNLQMIMEDDTEFNLTKTDCKMLRKLFELHIEIKAIEEQEIFFLGGREAYYYFKNIGILKE